jgi:hypothetical protein
MSTKGKIFVITFFSIALIIITVLSLGFFISPTVKTIDFSSANIKNVNVGIFKDGQWEYHILTEDSSEIDKLIVDIKDNWITNMKRVPQEKWYDINFDDFDDNFGSMSYKVRYYPKSDTLLFHEYKSLDFPNEVMSVTSSKYLKELLRKNGL